MKFHFANLWELIADTVGGRPALICDERVTTWADFDDRAARLAAVYAGAGLGAGAKVGTCLHNCGEYVEAQYAAFKLDACPINVNYRYQADELVYLLDNADAEAVVYQGCYAQRIQEIRDRLPKVKLYLQLDDGAEPLLEGARDYEQALSGVAPMPRISRDPLGIYMLYTGGTTGMPKGVMYHAGEFCERLLMLSAMGRGLPPPASLAEMRTLLQAQGDNFPVSLPACPLMHGTGMWLGAFVSLGVGGTLVLSPRLGLDPAHLWGLVAQHRVTDLVIVGDAFARPLLAELDDAEKRGQPHDLSSLAQIVSSGVMWSSEIKQGLLRHHDMMLVDTIGSTEGGMGMSVTSRALDSETARFDLNEDARVFTEDGREVQPGSGERGMIAVGGSVPVGYYKDPEKSAATFREINGVRYSFPGDFATVAEDGSIQLLGRGSVCINSAGEKIFPEEVEEALKRHPDVIDSLVVGVPDERFGERVVAVVACSGAAPEESGLIGFARSHLAGYKLPRQVVFVDGVERAANGKPDYKWAKRTALTELGLN